MLVPPTGSDSYHCEASSSSSDQVKVFQGNLAKVRFASLKTQNYIYDTYWTVRGIQHSQSPSSFFITQYTDTDGH